MHPGKEIYLFFGKYGMHGILGIMITFIFLSLIIYKVINISNKYKINTYEEFLNKLGAKNTIIKAIINIFLIMSFYIMIAGFSAYFEQELNISKIIGAIIISTLCYITFNKNIDGIVKVNSILVPILILFIFIFGIKNIKFNNWEIHNIQEHQNSIKWLISAILYASYNSITLIPVLIPVSKLVKNKKENKLIFILIITISVLLALIIFNLILKLEIDINTIELPTVYIASKLGTFYNLIYGIIILVSIFTTAISAGYGFLESNIKDEKKYKIINTIMCSSAIFVSNIGFSNLLNLLYPIFGILGLIQIYRIFIISLEKNT